MAKNYKKILGIAALLLSFCQLSTPLTIIFDLGGVAVHTSHAAAFKESGIKNYLRFLARNPHKIFTLSTFLRFRFLTFLSDIKPLHENEVVAHDERGNRINQLMCDWLKGTPSAEIRATISSFLKNNPTYFANSSERKLITSFAKMVFRPEQFIKTLTLHTEAHKLARYCKKQGHKLVVLSNMDAETMALLKEKYSSFFTLFDHIIASGDIGIIKPNPAAFQHVLDCGHEAHSSIFIDDRPENRQAAAALGFDTIFLEKKSGLAKEIDFQAIARYIDMRTTQLTPIIA